MENDWQQERKPSKRKPVGGEESSEPISFLTVTYFRRPQAPATDTWARPQTHSEACAETFLWIEAFIFTRKTP